MSNKQSSVDELIDQVEDFMGLIPVDIIQKARFNHLIESIDFALFALAGDMVNDFPEETKTRLKATIELKYKEFYKL
jgi:hypothetical protein